MTLLFIIMNQQEQIVLAEKIRKRLLIFLASLWCYTLAY